MEDFKIGEVGINISDKAAKEVIRLMKENNIPKDYCLRLGVKGGGCSGLSYTLGFDEKISPLDEIVDKKDFKLLVDNKSILYLEGTEVDFTDGLSGRGFVFNNPNKSSCGCGNSFKN